MNPAERLQPEEAFDVALSLELGIPLSELKERLSAREYVQYQRYYSEYGFGAEAEYIRSANLIITVIQQIQGAAGGKPPKLEMGDIYPQLLSPTKKNRRKRSANSLVDWDNTPEHLQKELIQEGLYDEDGNPMGYNPHR